MTGILQRIGVLPGIITILALVDGVVHLLLDYVLFGGRLWGSAAPAGAPPSGAAPGAGTAGMPPGGGGGGPSNPFILPLNELFLLNCLGYVALVAAFWLAPRWLGARRWLVDVALIVYAAASIVGWLEVGRPNPHNLGYRSKGLEIALILGLLAHLASMLQPKVVRRARLVTAA
jgi:hypothetical protein